MSTRVDETRHRLLEWTSGQMPSERLSHLVALQWGFKKLDPSHPNGGKDGGKDALMELDGKPWVMHSYFPRGQQSFTNIKKKFLGDLKGAKRHGEGMAFVTNQDLRAAEREKLIAAAAPFPIRLLHLEVIVTILDMPVMKETRSRFLGSYGDDAGVHVNITDSVVHGSVLAANTMNVHVGHGQRRLSPASTERLIAELSRFPPEDFALFTEGEEAAAFGEDIGAALMKAGWKCFCGGSGFTIPGGPPGRPRQTGVFLGWTPERPAPLRLAELLVKDGFKVTACLQETAASYLERRSWNSMRPQRPGNMPRTDYVCITVEPAR